MEFDLPKRDILISEAFKAVQVPDTDYGALRKLGSVSTRRKPALTQPSPIGMGEGGDAWLRKGR